ncbi:MAG TPA: D-2-hydroxyacid dehydrogenase, partial [Caulobacteraceae bacterium]
MTRLILFEPAHRRVAAELRRLAGDIELALVSGDGASITLDGAPLTDETAQPDWGWFSADSGFGPAGRALFVAMLKSRKLAWVHTGAAGVDGPIWRQLVDKGAALTTGHGQAISIAEYVIAGVLDHFQRWPERHAEQAARRWSRLPFREVAGTRWLIVGFGAIGEAVADRARAFGAHITGVRRSGAPHPAADRMARLADMRALLPDADVVVLATPLNSETVNLADADFLAAMKPRSVLVNVGRGGLVDEAALLTGLEAGAPGHAILDVFRTEPLPDDSPLWTHPKVTLTAHASAFGSGQTARNDALFLENLRRRLAGEP